MKNTYKLIFFILVIFSISSCNKEGNDAIKLDNIYAVADKQFTNALNENEDVNKLPRSVEADGSVRYVSPADWTSGFSPGSLWYMYEYTGDEKWKNAAMKRTEALEGQKNNRGTHDVGFMVYCSFGNGYRLTDNKEYKQIIIDASNSLISRYDKNIGLIKSWDWAPHKWQYPVIVDNMMNLEMLFFASEISGDTIYSYIAKTHAMNTLKNHYRSDYSCFHVVDYDTNTYQVIEKVTHQGAFDSSSWARGQAWGLYGFTMTYRNTKDKKFLDHAEKISAYIMNNQSIPEDNIPYWDYNAAGIPEAPRDASAAAITASALLELQEYIPAKKDQYLAYAGKILKSLSSEEYLAAPGTNGNFLLKHSTGSFPEKSEVNTALSYADYYFLEALLRYKKIK